jgi:hypothetical protein
VCVECVRVHVCASEAQHALGRRPQESPLRCKPIDAVVATMEPKRANREPLRKMQRSRAGSTGDDAPCSIRLCLVCAHGNGLALITELVDGCAGVSTHLCDGPPYGFSASDESSPGSIGESLRNSRLASRDCSKLRWSRTTSVLNSAGADAFVRRPSDATVEKDALRCDRMRDEAACLACSSRRNRLSTLPGVR